MSKNLPIIFVISLFVCILLLGVYLFAVFNVMSKKDTSGKLGNFTAIKYYPVNDYYIFTFTLSDEFINSPVLIKDVNNMLIATALLSVKASYFNAYGKKDSVTIPLVIQKQNGDIIAFGNQKVKSFPSSYIPEFVQFLKDKGNWLNGHQGFADITINLESTFSKNPDLSSSHDLISDVVNQYQKGREKDMQNFLNTGDSKIGVIVPIFVNSSNN